MKKKWKFRKWEIILGGLLLLLENEGKITSRWRGRGVAERAERQRDRETHWQWQRATGCLVFLISLSFITWLLGRLASAKRIDSAVNDHLCARTEIEEEGERRKNWSP